MKKKKDFYEEICKKHREELKNYEFDQRVYAINSGKDGFDLVVLVNRDKKHETLQVSTNDRLATYIETTGLDKILKAIDKII